MDKKELQKKLNDIKSQIKANSKDAHFADTLINELLTTKAKIGVEPIELNVGKRIDAFSGETFEIVKTDRGAMYHEFGGYTVFVENRNNVSLYQTLCEYIDNKDKFAEMEGEEKEQFELQTQAVAYCLGVPKYCFSDATFFYELATYIVEFIRQQYEMLLDEPLQEETIEEDREFEDAAIAFEEMKNLATEKE